MRLFSQFSKCLQRVPPSIFSIFQRNACSKNSPRAPFYIFRHYATCRRPKKISKKKIRNKISDFFSIFPHAGTVEENTWHFEVLLPFLSLRHVAPTWAVPGLFLCLQPINSNSCFFNVFAQRRGKVTPYNGSPILKRVMKMKKWSMPYDRRNMIVSKYIILQTGNKTNVTISGRP